MWSYIVLYGVRWFSCSPRGSIGYIYDTYFSDVIIIISFPSYCGLYCYWRRDITTPSFFDGNLCRRFLAESLPLLSTLSSQSNRTLRTDYSISGHGRSGQRSMQNENVTFHINSCYRPVARSYIQASGWLGYLALFAVNCYREYGLWTSPCSAVWLVSRDLRLLSIQEIVYNGS